MFHLLFPYHLQGSTDLNFPPQSLSPAGSASSGGDRDALNVSESETELPKSIIVTNVDLSVFDDDETKVKWRHRDQLLIRQRKTEHIQE